MIPDTNQHPYQPWHHSIIMDWQNKLTLGPWSILFVITGLLIWIIKIVSGSSNQVLIIGYYACAVAALICVLFPGINVAKIITERK